MSDKLVFTEELTPENFKEFIDEKEDCKPYDQSWLLALIAPRYLCVGSAIEDKGADPKSEFLTSSRNIS